MNDKSLELQNKVSMVTGAGKGIGAAIALRFAQEGSLVALINLNETRAKKMAQKIESAGGTCIWLNADVSNSAEIKKAVDRINDKFGDIDILINNAGIANPARSFLESTEEEWDRDFAVNLKGPFICTHTVLKQMLKNKYGKIVNISSIAGKIGDLASAPCYGASKAGMTCLAKSLARELASYNINVNVVAPHAIETDMSKEWPEEKRKNIIANIPLGRMGEPEDIAERII